MVVGGGAGGPAQSYVGFLCKRAKFCARATARCFVWVVGEGAPAMRASTGRGLGWRSERVRGWLKSGLKHCLDTLRTCKKSAGLMSS